MAWHVRMHLLLKAFILIIGFSPSLSYSEGPSRKKPTGSGFRVNLIHRDSLHANEMTPMERMARAAERSRSRQLKLQNIIAASSGVDVPVDLSPDDEYLMGVGVGTPTENFDAVMSLANDLIWTQCAPCIRCFNQSGPIFDPSKSSTYGKIPCLDPICQTMNQSCTIDCEYTYPYDGASATRGTLSFETMALGVSALAANVAFGCSNNTDGAIDNGKGMVGLGRGPLSLISQLGPAIEYKFAYCLPNELDRTTSLFFGNNGAPDVGAKTVSYLTNNNSQTFYYLPMVGIKVNDSLLPIDPSVFAIDSNGGGGVIIDTGTPVTVLNNASYSALKQAFQKTVSAATVDPIAGYDLCYNATSNEDMPTLSFQFSGNIDWLFPIDNYFLQIFPYDIYCLAILGVSGSGPSIIGNILQRNFQLSFDNFGNTLSFVPLNCDER